MKKALVIILLTLLAATLALLYIAYVYQPSAETGTVAHAPPTHRVETRDYVFNVTEAGQGNPVILLHGAGTWLYSYRDTLPELARTHKVYALDLPGHGYTLSRRAPQRYDLDLYAEAIRQFMDREGIRKASIVGHSFGGGWAVHFAARHPERVDKLALLAPRVLDTPYKLEWRLMQYAPLGELFSKLVRRADVRRALEDAYHAPGRVDDAMVEALYRPLTRTENRRAQYRLVRDSDWTVTQRELPGLRMPTLVIWGEDDSYLPVGLMDELRRRMPQAGYLRLRRCGHALQEECPEFVNLYLDIFLGQSSLPD